MNVCWESDVSAFQYVIQVCPSFNSKEKLSFNFTAAVTILSDFGALENKVCYSFHFLPIFCHDLSFLNVEFKPGFSLFFFTYIQRFLSSLLSTIRLVLYAFLKLLIFVPEIKTKDCTFTWHMWATFLLTWKNQRGKINL